MTDIVDLVERSLSVETAETFDERVAAQADSLRTAIANGDLDNHDFSIGLEVEVYAIEDGDGDRSRLAELPEAVFESAAGKELGVHNAELNTDPDVFSESGLERQAKRLEDALASARAAARDSNTHVVLDAMWTLAPTEGSGPYLSAVEDRAGVVVAENMRPDPRYLAIDNDCLRAAGGAIPFDAPGVAREFPSMLFESLATSIQPHLQVPDADAVPAYFNAAIRTLGPVLALSTNSPFLPPDLYTDVDDPAALLEETHHELRIAVFEQSVNQTPSDKVRVPTDIATPEATVDGVVADDRCAPFLREWLADDERDTFADSLWEFDHKRGTYWRWVRCVAGGDTVDGACDERSLRIEYRPLPTQPTVRDVVALQALVGGLLRGLVAADHPITALPWEAAETSFYSAAQDGLTADLAWVTADGERTTDSDVIFGELFEYASRGLAAAGLSEDSIEHHLAPLEARVAAGMTPSAWKIERVREELVAGQSLEAAIRSMQRTYGERSRGHDSFGDWL